MRPATSKNSRPLRVLHCPWNVADHPGTLARAERQLGLASCSVEIVANQYGFEADEIWGVRSDHPFKQEAQRWRLLLKAIRDFDVVHLNFGQSILTSEPYPKETLSDAQSSLARIELFYRRHVWMADLPILKWFRKGIVMTYQGDDARQGDECRRRFAVTAANHVSTDYYNHHTDQWKRKAIAKVARYADRIYSLNPDLLHVLPSGARFLPYANVDPRQWVSNVGKRNAVPLVVHAPTHRGVKGTEFVLKAIQRLRDEKVSFNFQLIEDLTRAEARLLYDRADLLVDQLLIGWYGGLAVEFMSLQKPVICYLREEDLLFIPPAMRRDLPIIPAHPETIYHVLKYMITTRKGELAEIGRRGRAFVETWHDPIKIAEQLVPEYYTISRRRRN